MALRTCMHERTDGERGSAVTLACCEEATVGPFCFEHAPKSEDKGAPYSVCSEAVRGWSNHSAFADALDEYCNRVRDGHSGVQITGYSAEPSDENGEGGTDGLTDDERLLIEYAEDAL